MMKPLKILTDGRGLFVTNLTFGRARLHIGKTDAEYFDDGW